MPTFAAVYILYNIISIKVMTQEELQQHFSNRLTAIMQQQGKTAAQVAQMTGLHPSNMTGFMRGQKNPTLQTIDRFAQAFGLPLWHFVADPAEVTADLQRRIDEGEQLAQLLRQRIADQERTIAEQAQRIRQMEAQQQAASVPVGTTDGKAPQDASQAPQTATDAPDLITIDPRTGESIRYRRMQ